MISLFEDRIKTPCGPLSLVFDDQETLLHVDFPDVAERQKRLLSARFGKFQLVARVSTGLAQAFSRYFSGEQTALSGIRFETGGTDFQRAVWEKLLEIPCGQTQSYAELAKAVGNPKAVRAVARANALNPISILIPCHRVIGSNGTLTGYAGGLERKEWLLRHEGAKLSAL